MGDPAKVNATTTTVDTSQTVDTGESVDVGTDTTTTTTTDPNKSVFQVAGALVSTMGPAGFMMPFAVSQYYGTIYRGQIDEAEKEEKSIEAYAKRAAAATNPTVKNKLYSKVLYFARRRLNKPFTDDAAKHKWTLKLVNWAIDNKDYKIAYDILRPEHTGIWKVKDKDLQKAYIKLFDLGVDAWIDAAKSKASVGDYIEAQRILKKSYYVMRHYIRLGTNEELYTLTRRDPLDRGKIISDLRTQYARKSSVLLNKHDDYDNYRMLGPIPQAQLPTGDWINMDYGANDALVKDLKRLVTELAAIQPTTDTNRRKIVVINAQIKIRKDAIEKVITLDRVRGEVKHLDLDLLIDQTQKKIVLAALNPLPGTYYESLEDYDAIFAYLAAEKQEGKVIDWVLSKHPTGFRQALHENIETQDVCYDRKLGKDFDSCVDYYEFDPKDAADLPYSRVFRNSKDPDVIRLMNFIDQVKIYKTIPGGSQGKQGDFANYMFFSVNSIGDLKTMTKRIHETFGVNELPAGIKKGMLEVEKLENTENKEDDSHQRVLALNQSMGRIDGYAKRMKGIENMTAATKNPATPNSLPSLADLRAFVDETIKDNDALIKSLEARSAFLENIIITKDNRWLAQPPDAEWKAIKWRKKEYAEVNKDLQKLYSARTGLITFRANYVHDNKKMHVSADTIEVFKLMHFDGLLIAESRHARRLMEGECVMIEGIPILKEKGDPAGARDVNPIHSEMTLDMSPQEFFINSQRDLTGQSKTPKPVIITSDRIAAYHKRFGELRQKLSKVAMARSIDAKIIVLKSKADTVNSDDWFSLKTVKNFGFFLADSTFWDVSPDQYDAKDPFTFMAGRYMRVRKEINQAFYNNDADKFASAQNHFLQLEYASDHSFLDKTFKDAEFWLNLKVGVAVVTLSALTAGVGDKLLAPALVRLASLGRFGLFASRIAQPLIWNGTFVASNRIYGGAFQDGWAGAWSAAKGIVNDPLGFGVETVKMALMMKFIAGTGKVAHKLFDKAIGAKAQAYLQKMSVPVIENGVVRMPTGWQVAKEMLAYGMVKGAAPLWMFGAEVGGFQAWEGLDKTATQFYKTGMMDPVGNFSHAFQWKQIRHGGQFIIGLRFGNVLALPITKPINNATEKWIYKKFEKEFTEYSKFTEETIAEIKKFDPEKGDHAAFVKDLRTRLKKHKDFLDRFPKDITFVNEHKYFNEQLGKQLDYIETSYQASAPIFAKGNPYGVKTMVMSDKYKTSMDQELQVAVGINYTFASHKGAELVTALHNAATVTSLRVFDNGVVQVEMTHPLTQQSHSMMFIPKGNPSKSELAKMQTTAASPKPKPKPELTVIQGGGATTTTPQTKPAANSPVTAKPKKVAQ